MTVTVTTTYPPRRTASDPPGEPNDPPLARKALALALARRDERIALIALPARRPALLARARDGYAAAGRPGDARRCAGLIG